MLNNICEILPMKLRSSTRQAVQRKADCAQEPEIFCHLKKWQRNLSLLLFVRDSVRVVSQIVESMKS